MRKIVAVATVVAALTLAASTPANAATTGWVNGSQTKTLSGCVVYSGNGSKVAWADENFNNPCSGNVGVRARITTGSVVTTSEWVEHSTGATVTVGTGRGIISHQAKH